MIVTTPQGRRRSDLAATEDVAVLQERLAALAPEAQAAALALIGDAAEDPGTLGVLAALQAANYRWEPVGIAEFVDDPYYLGEACATLYPVLRDDLIALFATPHDQVLIAGSIGFGKTMFGSVAVCYMLYILSCMGAPQRTFGLSPGSEIILMTVSRNLPLAREVMKTAVDDKIKLSPYFQQHFPPDMRTDYTGFPNNVRLTIGSYGSERALGNNVIASWIDEINFPPKRNAQQIHQGMGQRATAANYDVAEKVYRSYVRRIKSRFANMGGALSGMVIMTSSATTLESFTERKMKEARDDPQIFVREHTNWTTKPRSAFCGEVFWVLCSRTSTQARILRDDEVVGYIGNPPPDSWVLDVPVEFREDFESNMEEALRDIAGISTQAISAFIQRLDALERCWDPARAHPFSVGEWTAGGPGGWRWEQLCQRVTRRLRGGSTEEGWVPRVRPDAPRWIHVDTSLSGDATGLAMVHLDGWIEVRRRSPEGTHYVEAAPQVEVDAVLRINPPPGEQIYLPDVRRLIYELRDHGFNIAGVSTDTFQSSELHQQLRRRGFHTELLSVDTSMAPYEELKAAVYEGRLRGYAYPALIEELKQLEYDRVRGKIDHPKHACFTGDTEVLLSDGRAYRMDQLAGQRVRCYAAASDGTVGTSDAIGHLTMWTDRLVRIVLDSGTVVRCTPDHRWMRTDGTFVRADELTGHDRLMPMSAVGTRSGMVRSVRAVVQERLEEAVPVYDLTVPGPENFALAAGIFVHNSKDCADSLAGSLWGICRLAGQLPVAAGGGTSEREPLTISVSGGLVPVAEARAVIDGDDLAPEGPAQQTRRGPIMLMG